ncbi:hypothetical protein GUJ93_ZPchr0006g43936 [Zizania palustris]|uniref:Lipoxygenase domain-containing protein n=1 Tax=Zizania palustris TaxID=103762 RepID=A0A8J5T6S4_ZIZPA|nr:hypothetical protein GUJ93_ZPchr0006g43936 [Zizania palustris]
MVAAFASLRLRAAWPPPLHLAASAPPGRCLRISPPSRHLAAASNRLPGHRLNFDGDDDDLASQMLPPLQESSSMWDSGQCQETSLDNQIRYLCWCSFLEPYLPSETLLGLKELSENELQDLRGDGIEFDIWM